MENKTQAEAASSSNYAEALASYETMIRERDEEIERLKKDITDSRRAWQKEQRLISSAWYELGIQLQRRGGIKDTGSPGGASWLTQQRNLLESRINRR